MGRATAAPFLPLNTMAMKMFFFRFVSKLTQVELLGASNSGSFFATQYNDNDNVFLQVCDGGKTLKLTKNRRAVK